MGGLCPIIAPQARLIDRRWNVGAFDFKQRSWLALPEQTRAMDFLKTDSKIVQFIVRGHYALVLAVRGGTVILGSDHTPCALLCPWYSHPQRTRKEKRPSSAGLGSDLFASDPSPLAD
jgi:hypothetical protein